GNIYGFVDVLVHIDPAAAPTTPARITLDLIEAPRAIAVLNPDDYRQLDAYIVHVRQQTNELDAPGLLTRVRDRVLHGGSMQRRAITERTQVWTAERIEYYRGQRAAFGPQRALEASHVNRLGRIPVVHIQNLPQPLFYEGLSEVEPLIPLQDELNTRLSDRANRVTFQSFKMYLGKGIERFTERPVGPGQMWSTDNTEAAIEEFGGDAHNPSEETHINEIRDALDKTSGVPPVAAGMIRDKVGNLTSENALRIVMMGLLAKTEKKRITYGAGLQRLCDLILHAADVHGLLPNTPDERRVRLEWPNALPDNETQRLANAQRKLELGVPREQVLAELGYTGGTG
ncbi:MAG: phage portal protein, partial [Phycisphaeraceae bacterium]